MTRINLNEEQEKLKITLDEYLNKLKEDLESEVLSPQERSENYDEMANVAHQLHMSLKELGNEPVHHRYMINNRGMEPSNKHFYRHIHPVEDLLAFIEDVHANDDPSDQTIGSTFSMKIYTRRWGHEDNYKLTRNEDGWFIQRLTKNGQCDKQGKGILYESLDHELVNYPADLPNYLEWLWNQAAEEGLNEEEVQKSLDDLADWINICEKSTPKGVFKGYK